MELEDNERRILHAALGLYEAQVRLMEGLFLVRDDDEMTSTLQHDLLAVKALREKL